MSARTGMQNFECNNSAGGALPQMANSATVLRTILQVDSYADALSILGLYFQPKLVEKDIIAAFRRIALVLHPDKCQNASQAELYTRLFQKLEAAKESLLKSGDLPDTTPEPLAIVEGPEGLRIKIFDAREKLKAARAEAVEVKYLSAKLQRKRARAKLVREYKAAGAEAHELRKQGKQSEAHKILSAAKDKLAGFNRKADLGPDAGPGWEDIPGKGCERVFADPTLVEDQWNRNLRHGKTSASTGVSLELRKRQELLQARRDFEEMYKIRPGQLEEAREKMQQKWLKQDAGGWTRLCEDAEGRLWWRSKADMEEEMAELGYRDSQIRWIPSGEAWARVLYWRKR
ncbi:hypothetical protein CERZMDRAFT_92298 [Cercospora zeae-maydis SCOH1-5]|uniref:J domain-containing protein n=1 Tax=Cercospora zeae-maydis SCOH1-5 TaxID=717836 RepID=A0A6A6FW61_9PEZI|nr:hypothetical protein CERZMDRAFT_92298 [Cercospora zeae-maydis SCOH1-5]